MIDRNHPAVEAALDAEDRTDGPMCRDTAHYILECTLPLLTAGDLRHTPTGKQLLAEGWDERHKARPDYSQGHDDDCMGWEDCRCGRYVNPYRD